MPPFKKALLLALAAVLFMGLGRILTLPPFEGSDETAHYSRIQAEAFATPGSESTFISQDVFGYYRQGPMPRGWIINPTLHNQDPLLEEGKDPEEEYTEYKEFLSAPARVEKYIKLYRDTPGRAEYTPGKEQNWQYQHPPFYYLLLSKVLRLAEEQPFVTRLLILRTASFLLAFTGFALGLVATLRHFELRGRKDAAPLIALGALYPFLTPVFFADFARLGNDGTCLLLFSIAWTLLLWHLRQPGEKEILVALGIAMGCAWLTKAFMVPVSGGLLLFLLARPERDRTGTRAQRLWRRLSPALTAGTVAFALGCWPYVASLAHGHLAGSMEFNNWLHGRGFAAEGTDIPWDKVFANLFYMCISSVYYFTDTLVSDVGAPATAAMLGLLILVVRNWASSLPRARWADLGREEWLPLFAIAPMLLGLMVHATIAGAAYGFGSATPGYYVHVLAPALAVIFGTGLRAWTLDPAGRMLVWALLAFAFLGNAAIMAARLALFSGCASFIEDGKRLALDKASCGVDKILYNLNVLAWPVPGLSLLLLSLVFLAAGAIIALKTLKTDKT